MRYGIATGIRGNHALRPHRKANGRWGLTKTRTPFSSQEGRSAANKDPLASHIAQKGYAQVPVDVEPPRRIEDPRPTIQELPSSSMSGATPSSALPAAGRGGPLTHAACSRQRPLTKIVMGLTSQKHSSPSSWSINRPTFARRICAAAPVFRVVAILPDNDLARLLSRPGPAARRGEANLSMALTVSFAVAITTRLLADAELPRPPSGGTQPSRRFVPDWHRI